MKRILVPIDFSDYSEYALEVAAHLAKPFNASIILFHMIGLSESVLSKSKLQEQEEVNYYFKLAKQKIKSFINRPYLKNITVHVVLQNFKIFTEINQVAKEQGADIIVMGSNGISGIGAFFVGSNTEKVVRTSEIPVLVIKTQHSSFAIKKICFACDLKPENAVAFKKIKVFAEMFNAELKLVYINTIGINFMSNTQIQKQIEVFWAAIGENIPIKIFNDYSIEQGIFNYGKTILADIIAIPTHGRKGVAHFFLGSVGENLANRATTPIMTLKI